MWYRKFRQVESDLSFPFRAHASCQSGKGQHESRFQKERRMDAAMVRCYGCMSGFRAEPKLRTKAAIGWALLWEGSVTPLFGGFAMSSSPHRRAESGGHQRVKTAKRSSWSPASCWTPVLSKRTPIAAQRAGCSRDSPERAKLSLFNI